MYYSSLACLLLLVATAYAQSSFPAENTTMEAVTTESSGAMDTDSSETTPCEHEGSGDHLHHHRGHEGEHEGRGEGRENGRNSIRGDRGNEGHIGERQGDRTPYDTFRAWIW